MSGYRLSPRAQADLKEIWSYTARRWSQEQADRYYGELVSVFEELTHGEKKGRAVDIRKGYLKYPVRSHFIFYKVSGADIDIIRILHQRMDVERHL